MTEGLAARNAGAVDMPEEPTQARRFGQARSARSSSLLEDYVELIADLLASQGEARATDVAKRFGVTHPTAIKSINRLKREGLVTARPYRGIFLTHTGQAMAERLRARHRLMVELLLAVGSRRKRRKPTPRAWNTTPRRRPWRRSRGFWRAGSSARDPHIPSSASPG